MTVAEIQDTLADYRAAATNAISAGFDGVEVHSANGYLLQQFITPNVNDRTDEYGGSVENRIRFSIEAVDAATEAIGAERVGVRVSPLFGFSGIADPDPAPAYQLLGKELSQRSIAYLHVADTGTMAPNAESVMPQILAVMDGAFDGPVVLNGAYDAQRARDDIESGVADAIAFGRAFLANPDLPKRLAEGLELNTPDPKTFYGGGAHGYTDYPTSD